MMIIVWIFIFAILITFVVYLLVKYIAERNSEFDFERFKILFKIYAIIMLIVMIILLFIFRIIILNILISNETNSFLFTLMVAISLGLYLNGLGIANKGIKDKKTKYILFIILIIIFVVINSYYDFLFIFDVDFLTYKKLSISSAHGIWFLWYNFWIFTIIYILSFTIESEQTE